MATVKIIHLTDGKTQWASLLIGSISIGQKAVQDVIGNKILEFQLNDHAIYDKDELLDKMVGTYTGKMVFKDICEKMYDNRPIIMNMNGGYIPQDSIDWETIEVKTFEFTSWKNTNLLQLLKDENKVTEGFTQI